MDAAGGSVVSHVTYGDKIIDLNDLAALKQNLLKMSGSELSTIAKIRGDINDDQSISISDLLAVKKHILGISLIS
jgi:hypothetical protein